jgi:transcriptional regulator with XRE-family HTH domain
MELKPEAGASEPLPEERFKARAFAARLGELRKARGLTQTQMAEKMHTTRTYISKIEISRNFPKVKTVLRMAGVLGIEMEHLLDGRLSVEDLATRTAEDLRAHEAFIDKIAEVLPGIEPWNLLILSKAAEAMATGQYTLPEWMRV